MLAGSCFKYGASSLRCRGFIFERIVLGIGFQEKVERVDYRHLGDQIDFDAEFARSLRKDQAREIIRLRDPVAS